MFWPEKCSLWIRVRYSGSNSFKIWVVHRVCGYHYGTRIVVALKKVMASVLGLICWYCRECKKIFCFVGGKKKSCHLVGILISRFVWMFVYWLSPSSDTDKNAGGDPAMYFIPHLGSKNEGGFIFFSVWKYPGIVNSVWVMIVTLPIFYLIFSHKHRPFADLWERGGVSGWACYE